MYWAHRALQQQYHRHCKADLIRVVLFNQSVMCTHVASILQVVEVASNHAVRLVTSHVLALLHGAVVGSAGPGGGAGAAGLAGLLFG